MATLPTVSAHGDVRGATGTVMLEPFGAFTFDAEIHWHRLVGTVSTQEPGASVEVDAIGPDGSFQVLAGPGEDLRVNRLVRCCLGATWSLHRFSVVNLDDRPVNVSLGLVLLHDDFAVIADGAEDGGAPQSLLAMTAIAAVPSVAARWVSAENDALARRWLRVGWFALAAGWALLGALALVGMIRHGGGALVGLRSAFAAAPLYNDVVSSFVFAMLAFTALWVVALSGWAVVMRRASDPTALGARWLALAAAVGPLVFGFLFAKEYGNAGLASLLALAPAGVIIGAALWPRRPWHRVHPPTN